jgi:hypothetical protein
MIRLEEIVSVARDAWWPDRFPRDAGERALVGALAEKFPEHTMRKSNCDCGEQRQCDECFDDLDQKGVYL